MPGPLTVNPHGPQAHIYLSPADALHHRVLTAMRKGCRLSDLPDLSVPAEAAMRRSFW